MPSCNLLIMGNWEIKQIYQQSWSFFTIGIDTIKLPQRRRIKLLDLDVY